jgi:t-SNARE complex subunit (syntaxin)
MNENTVAGCVFINKDGNMETITALDAAHKMVEAQKESDVLRCDLIKKQLKINEQLAKICDLNDEVDDLERRLNIELEANELIRKRRLDDQFVISQLRLDLEMQKDLRHTEPSNALSDINKTATSAMMEKQFTDYEVMKLKKLVIYLT